jgi:CheY-like chemotaxis protein
LERFLDWVNRETDHPPVLKAGLAHLWFVTLHPFDDGNGRIGRAVGDMLLARAENSPQRFYSLSAQIQLGRRDYYDILEHTQKGTLDFTPWLAWFAQLMESDSPPPTQAQTESIAQILQAGWHLLKLIDEVLDLAKIESRQIPMSKEPVLLAEVMAECGGMLEQQAQQRGICIVFPESDIPCYVLADRTRLKQVLLNLLSNAVKYNSEQGTVAVTYAASSPGRIRVSVRDTGAGLSREELPQLFQPFNRLGQEAGAVEGTGIGLVVAKRLVELMGGIIGVESTVGVGSVFWFELNSAEVPQLCVEGTLPMAPTQYGTRRRTLLYVEDNPANMKLVEQLIARRPDITLLTATNGNCGIALARTAQPTAILMDINLPDITGYEALIALRTDPATAHIPVVALSANAMPNDTEKGFHAGFFRYLTKPIKLEEFMNMLNAVMEFAEQTPLPRE